jgi:hypothetical protein
VRTVMRLGFRRGGSLTAGAVSLWCGLLCQHLIGSVCCRAHVAKYWEETCKTKHSDGASGIWNVHGYNFWAQQCNGGVVKCWVPGNGITGLGSCSKRCRNGVYAGCRPLAEAQPRPPGRGGAGAPLQSPPEQK